MPRSFCFAVVDFPSMPSEPPRPILTRASIEAVELSDLLRLVGSLAASDLGRQLVESSTPTEDEGEIRRRQARFEEAARLLGDGALIPSLEEPLRPLWHAVAGERGLEGGPELVRLAQVLSVVRAAVDRVLSAVPSVPALEAIFGQVPDCRALQQRIQRCLDARGRVKEDASPELRRLRRLVQGVRDGLYRQLQDTIVSHQEDFAEPTVSLKDGRLLLLLHSGARGRRQGLIHGRSATGQSLYFEPMEAVEGNNRLQEALDAEEEERRRIVQELLREVRNSRTEIECIFEALARFDQLQAISRFADCVEARLPELNETGELRLIAARHPLLDPSLAPLRQSVLGQSGHTGDIVPLDISLEAAQRILVVTGPNAGGKTVVLKTVGLLVAAAQCGLPVPAAAGTRIPIFTAIMAMVGDEQDLLSEQSTFSAKLIRLKEAWDCAGPGSLVLLDELGSGTDPEEGAAIAIALLEGLLERKSMAIITTHLTQLAAAALEKDGSGCAAMEFDPETSFPTYRLRPGAPGGSRAMALARRLDLPHSWIERAEELLGSEHRDLRRLLQEVEKVRQELASSQTSVGRQERELGRQLAELEAEKESVERARRRLSAETRKELAEFQRRATQRLRREVEALRVRPESARRGQVVSEVLERVLADAPTVEEVTEGDEVAPAVGHRVRHREFGWEGTLESLGPRRAQVRVRGKTIRCRPQELIGIAEERAPTDAGRARVVVQRRSEAAANELNLIGMRVEPALESLDRYLDGALLDGSAVVRIVHGFGTGRLRGAVRQHLKSHPAVARFRPGAPEEGDDGVTMVTLGDS